MKNKVLIVDDHLLSRKGIKSILAPRSDFIIVGEAVNGNEAVEKTRELKPDLILMDINMPGLSGLEATSLIKADNPYVKIIILSVSDDVQDFFEAIKRGAQGYLLKNMETEYWLEYITSIAKGEAPISRDVAAKILHEFSVKPVNAAAHNLSGREKEVLQLVSQGLGNKHIGAQLFISESTVKNHLRNILDKLHLESRGQLIAFAYKNGMVNF